MLQSAGLKAGTPGRSAGLGGEKLGRLHYFLCSAFRFWRAGRQVGRRSSDFFSSSDFFRKSVFFEKIRFSPISLFFQVATFFEKVFFSKKSIFRTVFRFLLPPKTAMGHCRTETLDSRHCKVNFTSVQGLSSMFLLTAGFISPWCRSFVENNCCQNSQSLDDSSEVRLNSDGLEAWCSIAPELCAPIKPFRSSTLVEIHSFFRHPT